MSLDPGLVGRVSPPTPLVAVSRAQIAAFADAIGASDRVHHDAEIARSAGHADVVAPTTFPIVVAFAALEAFLADPEVGIELRNVVHAGQRFAATRPVTAGDVVSAVLRVESLRTIAGTDIIGTCTDITTAQGEHICTASATVAHRTPEPGT
ncbi:MAG: MaoC family dehydratase N-terminal domain-containing protein [Nocardioidaceae bacterium]|nr:MaoC family dehydratase N-terminal domain-containing protein [Nocardioidaceae bacterium]